MKKIIKQANKALAKQGYLDTKDVRKLAKKVLTSKEDESAEVSSSELQQLQDIFEQAELTNAGRKEMEELLAFSNRYVGQFLDVDKEFFADSRKKGHSFLQTQPKETPVQQKGLIKATKKDEELESKAPEANDEYQTRDKTRERFSLLGTVEKAVHYLLGKDRTTAPKPHWGNLTDTVDPYLAPDWDSELVDTRRFDSMMSDVMEASAKKAVPLEYSPLHALFNGVIRS